MSSFASERRFSIVPGVRVPEPSAMSTTCLRAMCLLCLGFGVLVAHRAQACSATAPDTFIVGNKASDAACGYSKIQDAVNAATCPAGTRIYLTDEVAYTNQNITITSKNVSFIGRAPGLHCGTLTLACGVTVPCPTAPLQTIHGTFKVRGTSEVSFQYLTITDGHGVPDSHGTTYGGAIDFAAIGTLTLNTSTIENNSADNGGGIRFQGYGGTADMYLQPHTQIDHNEATNGGSGGGIRLEGQGMLHADDPYIWIHDNIAADKGGGIAIVGPARAQLSSLGDFFFGAPVGVVSYNTANRGGGVAVIAESTGSAAVDLVANAGKPARIEHNRAHATGGGVYAASWTNFPGEGSAGAYVFAGGVRIDDNKAQEGSGIYMDTDSGKGSYLSFDVNRCATGVECNSVSNNEAVNDSDIATAGSAILLQTNSAMAPAFQLVMRANKGAHAIRVADSLDGPMQIDTCLLTGNIVTGELVTTGNAATEITQCTFADNSIGGTAVINAHGPLSLTNSIVAQGTQPTLAYAGSGGGLNIDYVLSAETGSLNMGQHVFGGDPAFMDPGNGDFHLRADSPAIDKAPADAGDNRDLERLQRDLDMPNVPNLDGLRDLGAYERQSPFDCGTSDTIFCNGFEIL